MKFTYCKMAYGDSSDASEIIKTRESKDLR